MARRQRIQWYALHQRLSRSSTSRSSGGEENTAGRRSFSAVHCDPFRSLRFEPLEIRNMLSLSAGLPVGLVVNEVASEAALETDVVSVSVGQTETVFEGMWYDPEGTGAIPSDVPFWRVRHL